MVILFAFCIVFNAQSCEPTRSHEKSVPFLQGGDFIWWDLYGKIKFLKKKAKKVHLKPNDQWHKSLYKNLQMRLCEFMHICQHPICQNVK